MSPTEIQDRAYLRGIKLSVLLKYAGINYSTWWRWKQGKFQPRAASLAKIQKALSQPKK